MTKKLEQITININGKRIPVTVGVLISEVVQAIQPCGGKGKCGKCKVIAQGNLSEITEIELTHLSKEEISNGIRLACMTKILGECTITTQNKSKANVITDGIGEDFTLNPIFSNYGVAIDVGTTTIAIKLYDKNGKLLAKDGCLNPQNTYGADVISRVEHALKGKKEELRSVLVSAINKLITNVARQASIDSKLVDGAVITGNTVMLSLLTGEDVEPFSHSPFEPKNLFGYYATAKNLELLALNDDVQIYLPKCISAFVGADIVCALTAINFSEKNNSVFVDIGTNGEIASVVNGKISVCSTAAGPAFEGVGISCGMRGESGAIDKVTIVNGTLFPSIIGNGKACGICGSGIIDAVACLLNVGEISESGYLEHEVWLCNNVTINQDDIRAIQLAKSAICAGIETLIDVSKIKNTDMLYIAGGFGSFLNFNSAERIGLIPKGFSDKYKVLGNAALEGASRLLLDRYSINKSVEISQKAKSVNLSQNKIFIEKYTMGMLFEE